MSERSTSPAVTPRAILGVPALPPGSVSVGFSRLRSAVGRLHAGMAPSPVRILEATFGLLEHRVLAELCRIGVPDELDGPIDVAALARHLDADEEKLRTLLRFAATRGWVRIDRRGGVRPTRVTAFLRRSHPGGWRAWVDFASGDEVTAAVGALSVASSDDGFAAANGAPFFEWMADHPERWSVFDAAMAAGGRMHGLALAAAIDWSGGGTVCDVGGGTGHLLATLLELVPDLDGTVFDLPAVVERAVDHPQLKVVGGDAFEQVPAGFDTYLLVNVLHDWSDEDATRLLRRVAEAAEPSARIVVVDSEATTVPRRDIAVATDVLMAALTPGGKERDAAAFVRLANPVGLELAHSTRLASGDLAHIFRLS